MVVLLLAALVPVSELAVGLVNFAVTLALPPRVLPKLELREGIPEDCATFVVMPSMLVRPESAAALLEKLEIHYLANPDPQLRFALLTDFADAADGALPEDDGLPRSRPWRECSAERALRRGRPQRFFLFHRRRQWNAGAGLLDGLGTQARQAGRVQPVCCAATAAPTTPSAAATRASLPFIRYVITLDADTQLPREAAAPAGRHPCPSAQPGAFRRRTRGASSRATACLQPRISLHLPAARRSRFTRIWAASAGVDPYSTAVSDVYQDLFGAGSFTGKGIYDVDAFEAATGSTFPDNHILSHDLIEGNYARCGLVTDIELFDDFPAALSRLRPPRTPLDSRRLATAALAAPPCPATHRRAGGVSPRIPRARSEG